MKPPGANVARQIAEPASAPADLTCSKLQTLKKRADFVRAAKAVRVPCTAFLLQARQRGPDTDKGVRVGFTCSKKLGNAVARNRAKRRLRAVARDVITHQGRDGWDYVLVGRPGATVSHNFAAMCVDLQRALDKLHGGKT